MRTSLIQKFAFRVWVMLALSTALVIWMSTAKAMAQACNVPLTVTKNGPATVTPGGIAAYTIAVTAPVGVAVNNVIATDTLPPGFIATSVNSTVGSCSGVGTGTIICQLGTLVGTANIAIEATVPNLCQAGPAVNNVTVTHAACMSGAGSASFTSTINPGLPNLTKSGPATANAGEDISYIINVSVPAATGVPSTNTVVTDTLPPGFSVLTAISTAGACAGAGSGTVICQLGTLNPGAQATINIRVHIPFLCQPAAAVNSVTVTNDGCPAGAATTTFTTTISQANLGPGACYPYRNPIDDSKPGSVLFAPLYTSGASGTNPQENSRVNLTNVHPTLAVVLHLFFVDGSTCSVADAFLCLTPNQTTSFLMSDIDPGVKGYMMAIAVDGPAGTAGGTNTGCPISFNYLIGHSNIKFLGSPRRDLELEHEAVASEFGSPVPTCNPNNATAEIFFDGTARGYNQLPRVLAASSIPSRADGNDTILVLARIDGNWGTGLRPIGPITGLLYDDAENVFSFTFIVGECLLRQSLSNSFPRTTPRFDQVIPAGRSGWFKLWAADESAAIIGATHNRNDSSQSSAGAFEGGRNMHILRLLPSAVVTVPVFPPSC